MAEGPEVAKAFVTIIPSMKGAQAAITGELVAAATPAGKAAGATAGKGMTKGMGGNLSSSVPALFSGLGMDSAAAMSTKFTSAFAKGGIPMAITAVVAASLVGLYKLGSTFDEMTDIIIAGTGASGEALEDLRKSAKEVAQSVPADMDEVGQTIADLNTRLGVTGPTLETLSEQFIDAGHVLDTSLDVNKITAAFNAFNLSEDELSAAMDDLFTVSQATGIGMNELAASVSSNAASLQTLGFSFQDTAAMAGLLDKAGLNASGVFSKMSKGLVTLAKDGEEPAEAFQRTISELDALIQKGDDAAALNLATELFGTKGASQFIGAMKSGALSVDDLTAALAENDGAIVNTMSQTQDFAESWKMVKNNLMVAIEPLASGVFNVVGEVMKAIVPIVKAVVDVLQLLGSVLKPLAKAFGDVFGKIGSAVSNAVAGIRSAIEGLVSRIKGFTDKIRNFFHFKVEKPHIPLPHFKITPEGWRIRDLLKGIKPNLSLEWYAKGGIFDGAQVIGVGEKGPEAVLPLNARGLEPFAAALKEAGGGGDTYIVNGITYDDGSNVANAVSELMRAARIQRRANGYI